MSIPDPLREAIEALLRQDSPKTAEEEQQMGEYHQIGQHLVHLDVDIARAEQALNNSRIERHKVAGVHEYLLRSAALRRVARQQARSKEASEASQKACEFEL